MPMSKYTVLPRIASVRRLDGMVSPFPSIESAVLAAEGLEVGAISEKQIGWIVLDEDVLNYMNSRNQNQDE